MAVNLFFVLSGFLITTLMLCEISNLKSSRVNIKKFYMRRILRIWPPYYACLFIAIFILPSIPFFSKFLGTPPTSNSLGAYLVLLPNLSGHFGGSPRDINHLWSIGVEEQFYMLWPWLVKSKRWVWISGISIIIVAILIKSGLRISLAYDEMDLSTYKFWHGLISSMRIQCMAIGGVGAMIYSTKPEYLHWIYGKKAQYLIYLLLAALLMSNTRVSTINDELYCGLFLIVILNIALNPHSLLKFSWSGFSRLGDLSYGMYLYHMFAVYIVIQYPKPQWLDEHWFLFWVQQFAVLLLTLILSWFSYMTIERFFLSLKNKYFSSIQTK
jgi:peptidoglycan/LPS O-acetylase OafA/YrhL